MSNFSEGVQRSQQDSRTSSPALSDTGSISQNVNQLPQNPSQGYKPQQGYNQPAVPYGQNASYHSQNQQMVQGDQKPKQAMNQSYPTGTGMPLQTQFGGQLPHQNIQGQMPGQSFTQQPCHSGQYPQNQQQTLPGGPSGQYLQNQQQNVPGGPSGQYPQNKQQNLPGGPSRQYPQNQQHNLPGGPPGQYSQNPQQNLPGGPSGQFAQNKQQNIPGGPTGQYPRSPQQNLPGTPSGQFAQNKQQDLPGVPSGQYPQNKQQNIPEGPSGQFLQNQQQNLPGGPSSYQRGQNLQQPSPAASPRPQYPPVSNTQYNQNIGYADTSFEGATQRQPVPQNIAGYQSSGVQQISPAHQYKMEQPNYSYQNSQQPTQPVYSNQTSAGQAFGNSQTQYPYQQPQNISPHHQSQQLPHMSQPYRTPMMKHAPNPQQTNPNQSNSQYTTTQQVSQNQNYTGQEQPARIVPFSTQNIYDRTSTQQPGQRFQNQQTPQLYASMQQPATAAQSLPASQGFHQKPGQ
ncbi:hypothetical protein LOTGIDRAFT_136528, partial [Lottia gigantea]